jgi:putative tributyrin esterase
MALCTLQWGSERIGKRTRMKVLLPDRAGRGLCPACYLLHGMSDDDSIWLRQTRSQMYARPWPMIVVMPDGYREFYTHNQHRPDCARHIGAERAQFVERTCPAKPSRSARVISGLSMGGYGAMRIGPGYPRVVAGITAHSGARNVCRAPTCRRVAVLCRGLFAAGRS